MKLYTIFGFLLLAHFATGQQSRYDSLIRLAERERSNNSYEKSSQFYMAAFKAMNYKGFAPDRFNAAKTMSMAGNADSAFYYLNVLWNKTEYIETDSLLNEKMLQPLHSDIRWRKLIEETTPRMPELAKKLATIRATDQDNRQKVKAIADRYSGESPEYLTALSQLNTQDSINQAEVFAILDRYGWMGRGDIGNTGCSALFLVVQHAPIEAQEKYLPLMRAAVKEGKARKQNLAYLEDRVLVKRNKKQLYGSQLKPAGRGFFPIIDIEHLNERREYVGLAPFSKEEMAEIKRQSQSWK